MKVVVIGATGGIGREVVSQSLAEGFEVTALARRPEAVAARSPRLRVVRGDALDAASIAPAVEGADAVVSALGVRSIGKPTTLYSEGVGNVVKAMKASGVSRLVCVGASGYVKNPEDPFFMRAVLKPVLCYVLRHPYADNLRMEEVVRGSGLDWTVVRPTRLTNGPRTGRYRFHPEDVAGGKSISRADVADFIVKHLDDPATHHAAFGIAY